MCANVLFENINDFLRAFFAVEIGYCLLVIIVAVALFPILLLKSPQDFWPVVVGGMASTAIAVLLICIGSLIDYSTCAPHREFPPLKLTNGLFLHLGNDIYQRQLKSSWHSAPSSLLTVATLPSPPSNTI